MAQSVSIRLTRTCFQVCIFVLLISDKLWTIIKRYETKCCRTFHVYFHILQARPFKSPDFVSQWYYITSIPGKERIDVDHHLREVPAFVQVQIRSVSVQNYGYIFPGIGVVPRDDDDPTPYAAVTYIYNEKKITISGMSENNHHRGRIVYTENSTYWEGPNADDSFEAQVMVRAWKLSSFPKPDYQTRFNVTALCEVESDCFHEKYHGIKEYPTLVILRTKLSNSESEFDGFMSDAAGSGMETYDRHSGYVLFGFDSESIRIWIDASNGRTIFNGYDGTAFDSAFHSGELEIIAWQKATLNPSYMDTIQLGVVPGGVFDKDKHIGIDSPTENIIVTLWAEATDGPNAGFRFVASGSLAYVHVTRSACGYGGLTYAYSNTSIRIWKPATASIGKIICIPEVYGGGSYSQSSNHAVARTNIWIPQGSTLFANCGESADCFDANSGCINSTCQCRKGFYIGDGACQKYLTCKDEVPILPDLERRARNYFINSSNSTDRVIDDNSLQFSWYQATSAKGNYKMPDSSTVPLAFSCGSKHQVYVNGTHPSIGNITERPAKLNVCYKTCSEIAQVSVRMCPDGTLQYELGRLSFKDVSYCFDPPELQGIKAFESAPTVDAFTLRLDVELHFRHAFRTYLPYLTFNCTTNTTLTGNFFYTTYWYIGNSLFTALGPSRTIENLTEQMLLDRKQGLDVYISCGVRVSVSKTGRLTTLTKSPEVFYGIKVHEPVVYIRKGENAKVTIEPTAPIGCQYGDSENFPETCYQHFRMIFPDTDGCDVTNLIDVQKVRRCGGRMKACKFNETCARGVTYDYEFTTTDKNFADGYQFRLPLQLDGNLHKIWRNHRIKDIMVYVTNNNDYKYKQCYSHVDPHMQTVDGFHYENQHEGEFILYRNVKYGIEVQEKTTICNHGRAYCTCAIAVRAGGDVFLVNTCGGLKFIGFTSCSDGGILEVQKRTSLRYQVFTPIGTYINVQLRPHPGYDNLINTEIYMAPKDLGLTEGLCGFFDNNKTNDLRKRNKRSLPLDRHSHLQFSNEWRRKSFEPNYLLLNPAPVSTWNAERRDMFCYCEKALLQDTLSTGSNATCSASLYTGCTENKRSVTKQLCKHYDQKRKRRSILQDRYEELERRQQLVNKETVKRDKRATTTNNVTEDDAEKLCSNVINSRPAVKDFGHRLKSLDPQQAVAECTFDVFEGNDKTWADVYPAVLDQVIEANNERDPDYVKANEDEVERFNQQSCPRNCSGHGNCSIEGDCVCTDGFHGPDCSIDANDQLIIDDIQGDGMCDLENEQGGCRCQHFQTNNLLENFQCNISETLTMVNGSEYFSNSFLTSGVYLDIYNGICCVPRDRTKRSVTSLEIFTRLYTISVSNNGRAYSDGVAVHVFDSRCQQETTTTVGKGFVLKDRTCFISGLCRIENETLSTDNCRICLSNNSRHTWTDNCLMPDSNKGRTIGLVLGISGGLLLVIATIVIGCILKRKYGRRNKSFYDSASSEVKQSREMAHSSGRPDRKLFHRVNTEQ